MAAPPPPTLNPARMLHNSDEFSPVLWNLSPQLVSTIAQHLHSIHPDPSSDWELKPFDALLLSGNWTEINFGHCQAVLHCALRYITTRIATAKLKPLTALSDPTVLSWMNIKAVSVHIKPYLETKKITYSCHHESYFDERPFLSEALMHVPKNIITLLTQLSPLNYVSLDLRHMTRAQDVVFYKHFAGPSGRHHQVEIGLLRLSCPDFLSGIIIHWVKPTALYGLQIDTGLEGAAYLHGAVLMRNTLKRLAIRLTSKELALLDPRHPKEYDRAFFPITSRVLSIILGHFPLLTWLTVDVAASIEEPWVGDLELPMEHANNHSLQIHPKVEATVVEIAKVLNGCKSLRRVALTWRGGRSDWLMCSSTHPYRTRNFMTLIQALFRACPGLEGIAFLTEYMSYYSGLRQNDGSMMFKVGSSGMDRPGEWPAGLRGPLDYSEGVVQDTSAPDRVPSTDSSTSANVVPNGGRVDRNAVSYERLVAARHGASDRIAGQMFEKGAVNMQAYEENLIKWLYSGRPGFGLQPQATVSAQWIPPLPTARKTSDGLQTTSGTQKEEQE